ncbi:hypothetical protein L208DRAFT_860300 [Tricholoma matsutake]|nr:hypothetical protein L208DRAFT_860300 [Tricholoma matsutake 945]
MTPLLALALIGFLTLDFSAWIVVRYHEKAEEDVPSCKKPLFVLHRPPQQQIHMISKKNINNILRGTN